MGPLSGTLVLGRATIQGHRKGMNKKQTPFLAVLILILLAGSMPALAGSMYRWVDDQGNIHYGENPPTGVKSEEIHSYSPPPGGREQRREAPSWQREEQEEEAADTSTAEDEQSPTDEYCDQHRQNLEQLRSRTVVRTSDPDTGETRVLDEDEREQMLQETREALEECP